MPPSTSTDSDTLRVLDVENANAVFDALAAETTREILAAIHEEPGTPSELAARTDTTVQNAMYHLDKLRDADLVTVAETRYSSRGKEMRVYAPPEDPVVIFVGAEESDGLLSRLKRFLGAVALLASALAGLRAVVADAPDAVRDIALADSGRSLAALVGGAVLLAVARVASACDSGGGRRRTALVTGALVLCVCLTPAAIAYSPAVSGQYYTSDTPSSRVGTDAGAPAPDIESETVSLAVRGGSDALRAAVRENLADAFEARGAVVERAGLRRNVSNTLFAVHLSDDGIEAGGLTPRANLTVRYAFSEAGNAVTVQGGLDAAADRDAGPWALTVTETDRAGSGWFRYTRGNAELVTALNTIERAGVNPDAYRDEVAADAANATVTDAFDNWN